MQLADSQEFTEQTLKGFLLKNVQNSTDTRICNINKFLINRVDTFWDDVVVPLKNKNIFDGNKINWYFDIYREGLDAHNTISHPFEFYNITDTDINNITDKFISLDLTEYLEYGMTYLTDLYVLLTTWMKNNIVKLRLSTVYKSKDPLDWIMTVQINENNEDNVLNKTVENKEVIQIINNIGLLISTRV